MAASLSAQGKSLLKLPRLFVEDEYASLVGKAHFFHLAAGVKDHGVVLSLGAAVFPAPFGLGDNLLALLNGGLVAFNLQAVFAGSQLRPANLGGLRNVDSFGKGFRESR